MGFDPQEVINAYVGGKMNYDNGGSIYGIESLLGSPMDPRRQAEIMEERKSKRELEREQLRERSGLEFRELFGGSKGKEQLEKDKKAFREKYPTEIMNISEYPPKDFPEVEAAPRKRVLGKSETITDKTKLPGGVTTETSTETDTGTDTATTNFTAPEVTPEPTVPQEDPYAYNKDLMNKYLAELFKEEEGIDIGSTAAALGMIQGIGGSREDIKAAQESAEKLAALQMGREKTEREALGKAVTMGLTREQMEREAARLDPYYEAKGEESRATAEALGAFGGSGEKLGKFRQDIAEDILKTDYELQGLQLQIGKAPANSQEKANLQKEFNRKLEQRIDDRVKILTGGKGSIENYLLKSKFRSPSGMGYSIDQPQPKG